MKAFIFISKEGYTFQPGSKSIEPDVDNLQILGFGRGENSEEAFQNFLNESKWVQKTSFEEAIALELRHTDYWKFSVGFCLKQTPEGVSNA